ncbi:TolB family protein [Longitalea luteola]|uniref:TolB family protein n=1 Tax=Longitalea luteola TaxID=2812563 RepID=UPI001A9754EA|nr:PD40 domain-containing protein [Longitalea luteola]
MKFNCTSSAAWLIIALAGCFSACSSGTSNTIAYPQPTPDSAAKVFLPGIVSKDTLDFNATFTADGKTFLFARSQNRKYMIFQSVYSNKQWQPETISPLFDTLYSNVDPFVAADSAIYFISNRPKDNSDTTKDYDIYRMAKLADGYAAPEYLAAVNSDSTEYYVSVSRSGAIFFSSYRDGNLDLYVSKKGVNGYERPVTLGNSVNTQSDEHDPLIAPDESYIVFASDRPGGLGQADLYISYNLNGQWQTPTALGHGINTKTYEYCPYLSPDGKYFFFSSEFNVKWIGSDVLKR